METARGGALTDDDLQYLSPWPGRILWVACLVLWLVTMGGV